jgi:phosphoglycerate dehydrogenase-like enzyme
LFHRLLIYHSDSRIYKEILSRKLPQLEIHAAIHPEEAWGFIEKAEIILSWQIPDDLLRRAKHLHWFASTAAGNEDIVENPHLPRNVILTKATVYGEMMAEYVFAYLLSFCRNLSKYAEDQKRRAWDRKRPERLRGKVMGILGLGSVGKEIAKRAKQFGMVVLGVKRVAEPMRYVDEVFGPSNLTKIISMVDYLVVALPVTPQTKRFLGEKELRLMKEGAVLLNIGRGKTVDEEALTRVLKTGRIRAVLDVFEKEPLPLESELWDVENVAITPHVSGINIPDEICEEFIKNYRRWMKSKPMIGVVDRIKGY